MAFRFDAFNPLSQTSTQLTYAEQWLGQNLNVQVRVIGAGLSLNPMTGVMTGTVTSLQLFDVTDNQLLETVAIDPAHQSTIAASVTTMLNRSISVRNDIGSWFNGVSNRNFLVNAGGTQVTINQYNANGVVIGKVVATGTGFDQSLANGAVTSVQHQDANGVPIAGQFFNYSGNPVPLNSIAYSLGQLPQLYLLFVTGNDTITSTSFNTFDNLEGGAGNDVISASQQNSGFVSYEFASSAVSVNLATGTATGGEGTDNLTNIGGIFGSNYDDFIIGGNALASGTNTNSHLMGSNGNDTILGGAANEWITGDSHDSLQIPGNDSLDGGGGNNTIDFGMATGNIVMTLNATGGAIVSAAGIGTDTINNFQNVIGGSGNDNITGNASNNILYGLGGNNTLNGGGGNDTVSYGDIFGDSFFTGPQGVTANLALGTATNSFGGTDLLIALENITGSANADSLTGDANANQISGGGGNDTLNGGAGNDTLNGDGGVNTVSYLGAPGSATVNLATGTAQDGYGFTDTLMNIQKAIGTDQADVLIAGNSNGLDGGAGNDVLKSAAGANTLTGGLGSDVFVFNTTDLQPGTLNTITDLSWVTGAVGQNDRIRIEGVTSPVAGAFTFGGNTLLSLGVTGGTANIQIAGTGTGLLTVEYAPAVTSNANLGSLSTQNLDNLLIGNFDVNNVYNFSSTFTQYNAAGQAAVGDTFYDQGANAGGRDHTTYDPANAQPYSSVVDTYNAANKQTAQAGNRDDAGFVGFTWQTLFDPSNTQLYANFTNTYEPAAAGGAVFQQSLTYDPGQTFGSSFTQYDPLSQQNYSQYQNFYLPNGQVFQQNGHYDTGADAGHDWITTYDTPGTQTYSSYTNVYNSGAILYQTGAFDGGNFSGDTWVTVYATPGNTAHYDQNIYKPDGSVAAHIVV